MQRRPAIVLLLIGILIGLMSLPCSAQVERYELGKRLRRFEEAWQIAAPEIRLKSTPAMQQAVSSFFSLQLKKAAAKLDQAWIALRSSEISDFQRACLAYRIDIEKAIFESRAPTERVPSKDFSESDSAPSISIKLKSFYKTKKQIPEVTRVLIECVDQKSGEIFHQTETDFLQALEGIKVSANDLPQADYRIRCRLKCDDAELSLLEASFSVLADLDTQLVNMERVQRDKSLEINGSVRATLSEYRTLIEQGREPFTAETDYPFCQILGLANEIVKRPLESQVLLAEAAKTSDVWMVLTEGRKQVPVRLRAPQNQSGKLPVLFLFHGAGGSENMFFETYGAGQAVKLGLERGWLVVAPRQGLMGMGLNFEEMLNDLESFFDIDRSQVFLMGHSMGAAQVIQQVNLNPDLTRAAAAIGGGRPPRDPKKIANVPWFVSAGEFDFGRSGAKAFHQSLIKAGAANAIYVEYPGIEHLVIVQAALPQTFEFFDRIQSDK